MYIDNQASSTQKDRHWFNLLIIVVYALIGLFVGNFIGLIAIMPFYGFDPTMALASIGDISEGSSRVPLLIMQGVTSFCAFVVAPWWFLKKYKTDSLQGLFATDLGKSAVPILLVFGITVSFMFVNSLFIEWNANLDFPDGWFEEYALNQEQMLERITAFLTSFDNAGQFILALLVIALLPAIGEELLFRGIIQQEFFRATKNIHLAIWLSAFLFGFFHLQFYGMVPRMLLGGLFGYLYYWSGNLIYATVAHFVNNGLTLVMLYLYQQGAIEFDIQASESTPLETVAVFFIIGGILTYLFIKLQPKKTLPSNE